MSLVPVSMSRMVALEATIAIRVEPDGAAVLIAKHDYSFHRGSHYKECILCEIDPKPYL